MGQSEDRGGDQRDRRTGFAWKAGGVFAFALACAVVVATQQGSLRTPSLTPVGEEAGGGVVRDPETKFDPAVAWKHLTAQTDLGPRYPGSEAHLKTRDWIAEEMKKHCDNVRLQEFDHKWSRNGKTIKMWNVLGEQNYEKAEVRILLLAHWDTRPSADQEMDESKALTPILGANDGASGVAVLLELMRAMKDRLPKNVGVLYLMTDGEDLGPSLDEMFIGAKYFAANTPKPKPEYGILLDMIGDKDLRVPIEQNSYYYAKRLVDSLYKHAGEVGLAKTFPNEFGGYISDDHIPLNEAGLPTVDLIDFTYPSWHTLADTPDKCSPESLGKVGRLLETWLAKEKPFRMRG